MLFLILFGGYGLSLKYIYAFGKFTSTHCSGQAAVITPRQVTSGLGSRRVRAIAAAKHHTVIATEGGEVFTWGSNRGKFDNTYIHIRH